jgi:hypothetical protein
MRDFYKRVILTVFDIFISFNTSYMCQTDVRVNIFNSIIK